MDPLTASVAVSSSGRQAPVDLIEVVQVVCSCGSPAFLPVAQRLCDGWSNSSCAGQACADDVVKVQHAGRKDRQPCG